MHGSKHRREQGFTLIEVMIVVAIIGILVTIAVTTFIGLVGRFRLSTECRMLNQSLQEARLKSISTGIPHGVVFIRRAAPQPDTYYVFMDCAQDGGLGGDLRFTDNDSNPGNNSPLDGLTACASSNYDPRVRNSAAVDLAIGNDFGDILGWDSAADSDGDLEYVAFNPTGQMVRGNAIAIGPGGVNEITILRQMDDGVVWESGVTISPGTGLSYTFPMRHH